MLLFFIRPLNFSVTGFLFSGLKKSNYLLLWCPSNYITNPFLTKLVRSSRGYWPRSFFFFFFFCVFIVLGFVSSFHKFNLAVHCKYVILFFFLFLYNIFFYIIIFLYINMNGKSHAHNW